YRFTIQPTRFQYTAVSDTLESQCDTDNADKHVSPSRLVSAIFEISGLIEVSRTQRVRGCCLAVVTIAIQHPVVIRGYPRQLRLDAFGNRLIRAFEGDFVPGDVRAQRRLEILRINFNHAIGIVDTREGHE